MENIFITKTNNEWNTNRNFDFYKILRNFLNSEITSLDEYISWVHQWKAYEKELVFAIKFARKMRQSHTAKYNGEKTNEKYVNHYQIMKLDLRKTANLFYESRQKKKDFFKKSDFFNINKHIEKELEYV